MSQNEHLFHHIKPQRTKKKRKEKMKLEPLPSASVEGQQENQMDLIRSASRAHYWHWDEANKSHEVSS